jgi:hypothetical protein
MTTKAAEKIPTRRKRKRSESIMKSKRESKDTQAPDEMVEEKDEVEERREGRFFNYTNSELLLQAGELLVEYGRRTGQWPFGEPEVVTSSGLKSVYEASLPAPDCRLGYTRDQLHQILGARYDEFTQWMQGQTIAICEGREYNPQTKSHTIACNGARHGVVTYRADVLRFLEGGAPLD